MKKDVLKLFFEILRFAIYLGIIVFGIIGILRLI